MLGAKLVGAGGDRVWVNHQAAKWMLGATLVGVWDGGVGVGVTTKRSSGRDEASSACGWGRGVCGTRHAGQKPPVCLPPHACQGTDARPVSRALFCSSAA